MANDYLGQAGLTALIAKIKTAISTAVSGLYTKPSTGVPKDDLASDVQTSLGKADTALQSFTETDPVFSASAASGITSTDITNWNNKTSSTGTVTSVAVKINNDVKGTVTTSGTIDLGSYAIKNTLANDADLNDIKTEGFYNAAGGNSISHKPSGVENFGMYVVHTAYGNFYVQKLLVTSGTSLVQYSRSCQNGTWGDWTQDKLTDTIVDISGKVDKVSGKGLSTNDFTTAEKNKLSGIASGAEVNVQSDWNTTDTSADSYIKNKPSSLPANGGDAEGLLKDGNGRFMYLSHSGANVLIFNLGAASNYASILICSSRGDSTSGCWPVVFCISFNWSGSSWENTPKVSYLYTTNHSSDKFSPVIKYDTSGNIYVYYGSGESTARLFYSYQGSNAQSLTYDIKSKSELPSGLNEASYEGGVLKNQVGTAIGSSSVPVYVKASGFVEECTNITASSATSAKYVIDNYDNSTPLYFKWKGGGGVTKVVSGSSSETKAESGYLVSAYTSGSNGVITYVAASNVTVGNSVKWGGYNISVGTWVQNDNTISFF